MQAFAMNWSSASTAVTCRGRFGGPTPAAVASQPHTSTLTIEVPFFTRPRWNHVLVTMSAVIAAQTALDAIGVRRSGEGSSGCVSD